MAPSDHRTNPNSASNMTGAALALAFGFAQVVNDAVIKVLVSDLGFFQILMVRGALILPVVYLILRLRDEVARDLGTTDKRLLYMRVVVEVALTFTMIKAISTLALADVTTILQAVPLGLTMAAALIFGEAVGWRRWLAILLGFFGVLLIVKPGTEGFRPEMFYAVASVVLFIVRDMITRKISASVPAFYALFLQVIGVTSFNLIMCYFDEWVLVSMADFGLLCISGILFVMMTLAAILMMRYGDISFVSQFRYSGILWAIAIGYLFFDEMPDSLSMIGAALVVSAGLYALYRERLSQKTLQYIKAL